MITSELLRQIIISRDVPHHMLTLFNNIAVDLVHTRNVFGHVKEVSEESCVAVGLEKLSFILP